jgi:predicted AlkP superfamily pyrophosphatase or phosphodiesterase
MKATLLLASFVVFFTSHGESATAPYANSPRNKLVVLMVDGCRWDYFKRAEEYHPGFKTIKDEGVVVEYVQPNFPSVSFPSWTTINTGIIKISKIHIFVKLHL